MQTLDRIKGNPPLVEYEGIQILWHGPLRSEEYRPSPQEGRERMSHRFSNSWRVRSAIMAQTKSPKPTSWESIPQELRVLILLHILDVIEEVLSENIS